MKKISIISLLIVLSVYCASCITTPVSLSTSTSPLDGKKIETNLGKTEGKDSTFSILGLWMVGRPDLNKAIEEAKKLKGADEIINVRCYETVTWFVLFSVTTVKIEGDAIKFSQEKTK